MEHLKTISELFDTDNKNETKKYWLLCTKHPYFDTALDKIEVLNNEKIIRKSDFMNVKVNRVFGATAINDDLIFIAYDSSEKWSMLGSKYQWMSVSKDFTSENYLNKAGCEYQGDIDVSKEILDRYNIEKSISKYNL